jgi:probable rRNA maturation factor
VQKIIIRNLNRKIKVNPARLKRFIRRTLQYKGEGDAGLSLLLVNDLKIKKLNQRYLNRSCPTDVLAFSSREGEGIGLNDWLGDIVVSTETAARQAKTFKTNLDEEIHLYLTHGLLHLLGWHHYTRKDREKMRREEAKIIKGCWCDE